MTELSLLDQHIHEISKEILSSTYLKKDTFDLRDYQIQIARAAIGKNFLVSIDTGLGKTLISIIVAANTLDMHANDYKVIMLAPTKPLIDQHVRSFNEFMTIQSPEDPGSLTGSIKPEKRIQFFNERKILFYTPQTLHNDLINNRYNLKKVCLIIFDEAHKASGDYAYVQIASLYREMNPDGNILALTASPGSSNEKIDLLCQTLFIPKNNVASKSKQDKDIEKYVQDLKIYSIGVQKTPFMQKIIDLLYEIKLENIMKLIKLRVIDVEKEKVDQIYMKLIIQTAEKLRDLVKNGSRDSNTLLGISVCAEIEQIYHMITVIESEGIIELKNYLNELKTKTSKASDRIRSDPRIRQIKLFIDQTEIKEPNYLIHPKIIKLSQIILEQLDKNQDFKLIVFVSLRDTINQLAEYFLQFHQIRSIKFVGQKSRSDIDKGLSQKEQIEILEQFKAGEYNVLLATSVAEEGLDIAECDCVIFYDNDASGKRRIQRMGRTARKRSGSVFILYTIDSFEERYKNIARIQQGNQYKNLKKRTETLAKSLVTKVTKDQTNLGKYTDKKSNDSNGKKDPVKSSDISNFLRSVEAQIASGSIRFIKQKEHLTSNSSKNILEVTQLAESILIKNDIPPYFGIRKGITATNIEIEYLDPKSSQFSSDDLDTFSPDIVIGKVIGVKIMSFKRIRTFLSILDLKDDLDSKDLKNDAIRILSRFELFVIFADFLMYDREMDGTKTQIIKDCKFLESKLGIPILVLTSPVDAIYLLNSMIHNYLNGKIIKNAPIPV